MKQMSVILTSFKFAKGTPETRRAMAQTWTAIQEFQSLFERRSFRFPIGPGGYVSTISLPPARMVFLIDLAEIDSRDREHAALLAGVAWELMGGPVGRRILELSPDISELWREGRFWFAIGVLQVVHDPKLFAHELKLAYTRAMLKEPLDSQDEERAVQRAEKQLRRILTPLWDLDEAEKPAEQLQRLIGLQLIPALTSPMDIEDPVRWVNRAEGNIQRSMAREVKAFYHRTCKGIEQLIEGLIAENDIGGAEQALEMLLSTDGDFSIDTHIANLAYWGEELSKRENEARARWNQVRARIGLTHTASQSSGGRSRTLERWWSWLRMEESDEKLISRRANWASIAPLAEELLRVVADIAVIRQAQESAQVLRDNLTELANKIGVLSNSIAEANLFFMDEEQVLATKCRELAKQIPGSLIEMDEHFVGAMLRHLLPQNAEQIRHRLQDDFQTALREFRANGISLREAIWRRASERVDEFARNLLRKPDATAEQLTLSDLAPIIPQEHWRNWGAQLNSVRPWLRIKPEALTREDTLHFIVLCPPNTEQHLKDSREIPCAEPRPWNERNRIVAVAWAKGLRLPDEWEDADMCRDAYEQLSDEEKLTVSTHMDVQW